MSEMSTDEVPSLKNYLKFIIGPCSSNHGHISFLLFLCYDECCSGFSAPLNLLSDINIFDYEPTVTIGQKPPQPV